VILIKFSLIVMAGSRCRASGPDGQEER